MDKEQARFVLRSFRPDGADAGDPDFAEALKRAVENRELGEWLADERAFDAEFAMALGAVDLPGQLREDIFACLAGERGDFPQAEDMNDAAWIGALASLEPPAFLRDQVIAAMERTDVREVVRVSFLRRAAIPLAAAAGIALAFFISRPADSTALVKTSSVPIDAVQAGFIRTYESPLFNLDEKREDHRLLVQNLEERKLPCPCCLPPGFRNVKGIGCRELVIDGKRGSLICFDERENGVIHVVIFRREDVSGELPDKKRPIFTQCGSWATARWQQGDNVFLLMSHTEVEKLTALF
ncbi:MAG: hypothetical protein RLZZ398_255 [Verrucomicrobiota bacterium]|jgi:hypothetical protein